MTAEQLEAQLTGVLRARFGVCQGRAEDEGFSDVVIAQIVTCLLPVVYPFLHQELIEEPKERLLFTHLREAWAELIEKASSESKVILPFFCKTCKFGSAQF